jgi:hypothetical protein
LARAAGDSMRSIADRLRRSGSTISRELQRNVDGQGRYRATAAHAQAYGRAVPAGRLADRLGPRGPVKVMVAGTALFALAYALFAVGSTNWLLLTVPFLAAGAAIGCVETAEHAAVAALAPTALRGSAFGPSKASATSPPAPSPDSSGPPSHPPPHSPTSPHGRPRRLRHRDQQPPPHTDPAHLASPTVTLRPGPRSGGLGLRRGRRRRRCARPDLRRCADRVLQLALVPVRQRPDRGSRGAGRAAYCAREPRGRRLAPRHVRRSRRGLGRYAH